MAKYDRTTLRSAALAQFEDPNGITWHEVVALLDFFEEVRTVNERVSSSRDRLMGVLDYLKGSATITAEQYEALANLARDID